MNQLVGENEPIHSRLLSRRGGLLPEIRSDGMLRLQGEREWLFEGSPDEVADVTAALPGIAERLGDSLALLSFGNAVGYFDVPRVGRVEVVSGKWGEGHFERMLRELMDEVVNIPFSSGDTGALPYDRSVAVHRDVLYHAFIYLRYILLGAAEREEQLGSALQLILHDPHRRFSRTIQDVPLDRARQVSGRSLARIMGGGGMSRVGTGVAALPLARALQGHLPDRLEESVARAEVDTPENRFAKAFLALCTGTIEGMRRTLGEPCNAFHRRILRDCEQMEALLRPLSSHTLWSEVGPMVHFPAASTVLQRRRGYRDLLRHWIRLRMATRLPLSAEQVRDLLEVKDISELYELWCFFSVVGALRTLLGPPAGADRPVVTDMHVFAPWDLAVDWPDGTRALYNPRFSRSRSGERRSYSVPLRPDIAVHLPDGPNRGLHLFDAKFRVDAVQGMIEGNDDETVDASAEERRGRFKRGDVYKMHTYRDALPAARSVWILYPGTEFTFFSADGLLRAGRPIDLPLTVDGVGAIPHLPGGGDDPDLLTILKGMLTPAEPDLP